MNDTSKLIIVGAGPAGLAAALEATNNSTQTLVFERSDRVGGLSRTMQFEDFCLPPHPEGDTSLPTVAHPRSTGASRSDLPQLSESDGGCFG